MVLAVSVTFWSTVIEVSAVSNALELDALSVCDALRLTLMPALSVTLPANSTDEPWLPTMSKAVPEGIELESS
jgi:hypothetical protein